MGEYEPEGSSVVLRLQERQAPERVLFVELCFAELDPAGLDEPSRTADLMHTGDLIFLNADDTEEP